MKKLVLGLATMTLLFASCSKNETTDVNGKSPNAIGFTMSTSGTKATVANLATLRADASGFGVYATNGSGAAQFINNAGYKWAGSAWEWDGTAYNWPGTSAGYPVHFYAYYPKSSATLARPALTNTYTIPAVASQVDYLAANKTGVTSRPASSNVELNFKHILSKVDFRVITGSNVTVEVQSIEVKNVGEARTFAFQTLTWGSAPAAYSASYKPLAAPVVSANRFVNRTTATAVTSPNGSLMLMPQDLSSRGWTTDYAPTTNDSYVEVVYRVFETAGGKDLVGLTNCADHPDYAGTPASGTPLFVKVGFSLPTDWEMGKAYAYTIHLGTLDTSGGNLTSDNFIDKDGDETDLPVIVDGEEKEVPQPIVDLDKPIGFIVSVSDWEDAAGIPLQ